MSLRETVMSTFQQVAELQKRTLAPLTDNLKLAECGLDSLSFALVVTYLEESLKVDPFHASAAVNYPVTFGDFIKLYEERLA